MSARLMQTKASYISRNSIPVQFQSSEGKEAVNLWLCSKSCNQDITTFDEQAAADKYKEEISAFENVNALIDDIFTRIDSNESPSKIASWYSNLSVEQIGELCKAQRSARPYLQLVLPTVSEMKLKKEDGSEPSLAIVHYLNHISPQFAGYFLENVIAHILDIPQSQWVVEHYTLPISENDKKLFEYITRSTFEDDRPSVILVESIKQWIAKRITIDSYEPIFKFCELMNDEIIHKQICDYIDDLSECEPIKNWKRLPLELKKHSLEVAGFIDTKYLHGEIDFLIANRIIDIKACKDIKLSSWFAQTMMYKCLYKGPVQHLKIISLLNNTIYSAQV